MEIKMNVNKCSDKNKIIYYNPNSDLKEFKSIKIYKDSNFSILKNEENNFYSQKDRIKIYHDKDEDTFYDYDYESEIKHNDAVSPSNASGSKDSPIKKKDDSTLETNPANSLDAEESVESIDADESVKSFSDFLKKMDILSCKYIDLKTAILDLEKSNTSPKSSDKDSKRNQLTIIKDRLGQLIVQVNDIEEQFKTTDSRIRNEIKKMNELLNKLIDQIRSIDKEISYSKTSSNSDNSSSAKDQDSKDKSSNDSSRNESSSSDSIFNRTKKGLFSIGKSVMGVYNETKLYQTFGTTLGTINTQLNEINDLFEKITLKLQNSISRQDISYFKYKMDSINFQLAKLNHQIERIEEVMPSGDEKLKNIRLLINKLCSDFHSIKKGLKEFDNLSYGSYDPYSYRYSNFNRYGEDPRRTDDSSLDIEYLFNNIEEDLKDFKELIVLVKFKDKKTIEAQFSNKILKPFKELMRKFEKSLVSTDPYNMGPYNGYRNEMRRTHSRLFMLRDDIDYMQKGLSDKYTTLNKRSRYESVDDFSFKLEKISSFIHKPRLSYQIGPLIDELDAIKNQLIELRNDAKTGFRSSHLVYTGNEIIQISSKIESRLLDIESMEKDLYDSLSTGENPFKKRMKSFAVQYSNLEKELQEFNENLAKLTYIKNSQSLEDQLEKKLIDPCKKLVDQFNTANDCGKDDVRIALFHKNLQDLCDKISNLRSLLKEKVESHPILATGLPNIGNSCFINAGLQLLQGGKFLEKLVESFSIGTSVLKENEKKELVEAEQANKTKVIEVLKPLIKSWKQDKGTLEKSLQALRSALYSGEQYSLRTSADRHRGDFEQHDGGSVIMSLLANLGYHVIYKSMRTGVEKTKSVGTAIETVKKFVFHGAPDPQPLLMLQVAPYKERDLQALINLNFSPVEHINDVKNACKTEIDGQAKVFETYTDQPQISLPNDTEPPQFLPVKVMRFTRPNEAETKERFDASMAKVLQEKEEELIKIAKQQLIKEMGNEITTGSFFNEILADRAKLLLNGEINSAMNIDANGNMKINDPIKLPANGLVDFSNVFGKTGPVNYRVVAYELHIGNSPSGGHYTTYRFEDDAWYYFDDKKVLKGTNALENMSQAYILLFERVKG